MLYLLTEYYQHVKMAKMHNLSLNRDPNLKASTYSIKKLLDQEAHKVKEFNNIVFLQ